MILGAYIDWVTKVCDINECNSLLDIFHDIPLYTI